MNEFKVEDRDKALLIDFDGTINSYKGYTGEADLPDPPVEGAIEILREYIDAGFRIHIMSTRGATSVGCQAIREYLAKHGLEDSYLKTISVSDQKIHGRLLIDDRAFHFEGTFPSVEYIEKFKPWNRK